MVATAEVDKKGRRATGLAWTPFTGLSGAEAHPDLVIALASWFPGRAASDPPPGYALSARAKRASS